MFLSLYLNTTHPKESQPTVLLLPVTFHKDSCCDNLGTIIVPVLTKSQAKNSNQDYHSMKPMVLGEVFERARREQRESLLVNLGTGERVTNLSLFHMVSD